MPKWVLEYADKTVECEDITEANKLMSKNQPKKFSIVFDNVFYTVNLLNGNILLNNDVICCDGMPNAKFRYINFQRVRVTYSGINVMNKEVEYFLGWQTTLNGKNIQRMVNVKPDLKYQIIAKG